jgi:hypothetical protein
VIDWKRWNLISKCLIFMIKFQRRILKCKSLPMMRSTDDDIGRIVTTISLVILIQTSRNLLRSCQSFGLTDMKILSDRKIFCRSEKKAPKDQCLILFLNYIIFIVFTPFIHFRFQPNPFVKTITTWLVICIYISHWHDVFHTTIDL